MVQRQTKNSKVRQRGVPSLFVIGTGFFIVVLMGLFLYGYIDFHRKNATFSYSDLKNKYPLVEGEEIYEFMNLTLFDSDSVIADSREHSKLVCLTLKHSAHLRKFINSLNDTVLTRKDKRFMKSQFVDQTFLWDQDKLINVWCLTPKDLAKVHDNDTSNYWENFRELYGNNGRDQYSRPIFNRNKTIVIIEHHGQADWLAGSARILLFRKEKGEWKLFKEKGLWVS